MGSKAFTAGCLGVSLSVDEISFFRDEKPWGLILFARNIDHPRQVADLCAKFRDAVGNADAPVLIDQEGGRVQRLRPPHWAEYPPVASIGTVYRHANKLGLRASWVLSRLHAFDLLKLGITVDCLPVLDVITPGAHDAIGDRSFGNDPDIVTMLGRSACDGLIAGGVMPVIKHLPGQGRARTDSHLELPVVDASREELEAVDFIPFRALADIAMAMTAHIVYPAFDPVNPATTSSTVISKVIRDEIGFDGFLMSDDVSMDALFGDCGERCKAIFAAGCDLVLHCNGDMAEMQLVAANSPEITGKSLQRSKKALATVGTTDASDEAALRKEFTALMAVV